MHNHNFCIFFLPNWISCGVESKFSNIFPFNSAILEVMLLLRKAFNLVGKVSEVHALESCNPEIQSHRKGLGAGELFNTLLLEVRMILEAKERIEITEQSLQAINQLPYTYSYAFALVHMLPLPSDTALGFNQKYTAIKTRAANIVPTSDFSFGFIVFTNGTRHPSGYAIVRQTNVV